MNASTAPILLFPTHYLGNFVLGLPWVLRVLEDQPQALLVLDSSFAELAAMVLGPEVELLLYPRRELAAGQPLLRRLRLYLAFLRRLRQRPQATLIDLEGERFTGVLARLSGCCRRIGPTGKRARSFYTEILDPDYYRHRFNAFGEVLADLAPASAPDSVLAWQAPAPLKQRVQQCLGEMVGQQPLVVIHPGASVSYKLWSRDYFERLAQGLSEMGCAVVWVGAGSMDADIIDDIRGRDGAAASLNLCNRLSVAELVVLLQRSALFIGSDSGPMHLAASTGIPVLALFGPSVESIWAPLGENSRVLRGSEACASDCDAWHCEFNYRCLDSLKPQQVLDAAQARLDLRPVEAYSN